MEAIQNLTEVSKKDFPLLENNFKSNNKIIYLDHAATTQNLYKSLKRLMNIIETSMQMFIEGPTN